eukprot:TRINITY_DN51705_c0_g1_i1.p1 TRINITY_DN51705_c0_g1~~TRINITY_DN51705_c0_g1_i1.p1  ORF type:complete len:142 (-),score=9.57 TRINITY_DN51705_c0_g1_i1:21-446(-)
MRAAESESLAQGLLTFYVSNTIVCVDFPRVSMLAAACARAVGLLHEQGSASCIVNKTENIVAHQSHQRRSRCDLTGAAYRALPRIVRVATWFANANVGWKWLNARRHPLVVCLNHCCLVPLQILLRDMIRAFVVACSTATF